MSKDKQYYCLLREFTNLSNKLIDKGFSYLVVMFSHELFRFMFLCDPYAKFTHKDPVNFITDRIKRLIKVAKVFSEAVVPYRFNLEEFNSNSWEDPMLEKATSNMYSELWKDFDVYTLTEESLKLVKKRIPQVVISESIRGKRVLDMGCGSGRYSIALARLGAKQVVGVDFQSKSFAAASEWCKKNKVPAVFRNANVHNLPFSDSSFDFVFSNGVLQASSSIEKGIKELSRVLKKSGSSFLYLLGAGGIHWNTRRELRKIFKRIPLAYTKNVLKVMGMPSNRFIFCDTWYAPLETNLTRIQLEKMLDRNGFTYEKVVSQNPFDLDLAFEKNIKDAKEMWGDAEHRYILHKK